MHNTNNTFLNRISIDELYKLYNDYKSQLGDVSILISMRIMERMVKILEVIQEKEGFLVHSKIK